MHQEVAWIVRQGRRLRLCAKKGSLDGAPKGAAWVVRLDCAPKRATWVVCQGDGLENAPKGGGFGGLHGV